MSTIYNRCMEVTLTMGGPGFSKIDQQETAGINAQHGTVKVARVVKSLMDDPLWGEIHALMGKIESFHKKNTLPYKRGIELLTVGNYSYYMKEIGKMIRELQEKQEKFCDPVYYETVVNNQLNRMKGLFKKEDFPKVWELKQKIYITHKMEPLSKLDGFYEIFDDTEMAKELAEKMTQDQSDSMSEVQKANWNRLYEVTKKLADVLNDVDHRVYKNHFDNIKEMADLVVRLSPVQDQTLENISKELTEKIAGIDPDDVKYDPENRKKIAETTESILDKMKGFI
jgi:hypothetical protein